MNIESIKWTVWIPIVISLGSLIISGFTTSSNNKSKKDLENLKAELNRQHSRKKELSDRQEALLFIVQNMTSDTIKIKKNTNENEVIARMTEIMKNKKYKKIFDLEIYTNPMVAFSNEIALSTCSEKVMVMRLLLQENTYKTKFKKEFGETIILVLYSFLYKYLYLDFTGNNIDDLYLLRHNLNDFDENQGIIIKMGKEIHNILETKYNWKDLKN